MIATPSGTASAAEAGTITQPAFVSESAAANLRSARNDTAPRSAEDRGATEAISVSPPRTTVPPISSARAVAVRDGRVSKNRRSGMGPTYWPWAWTGTGMRLKVRLGSVPFRRLMARSVTSMSVFSMKTLSRSSMRPQPFSR